MQVLSSLSGITFYAPSAGSAPTNSADVSAIASSYQVVSATATQLYAGTAYVTSVNSAPISASRAGNAANASLATSAWYDGSGRFISALPDSATVSSIAAAYAESAASSKQDTLTFGYDDTKISAINGSALAGGGAVTGDYVENSALDTATARSATGSVLPLVTGVSSISGQPLIPTYLANPTIQYGGQSTFVYMPETSMWTTADVATGVFSPLRYATGACLAMDAGDFKAFYKGNEWFVANTLYGYARGEAHGQRGIQVIVEHTGGALAALSARLNNANVTLQNTSYCTAKMSVSSTYAYVQVQRGNSDSRYNSAKLDTDFLKFYNGMTTGYLDPEDTASGTSYLPAETEYIYISSIPYWNGKQDALTFGYDAEDKISSINGSALGGMDEAAVSGIASAYAESAVSSVSSNYYTTANESGYALSSDVSATVDLVGTQSANWGGSALALSAGPGVKLEKSGNVLVASTDETVLWENYTFASNRSDSVVMSEDPFNFSYVQITFEMETTTETWPTVQTQIVDMVALSSCVNKDFTLNGTCVNGSVIYARCSRCHFNGTAINDIASVQWYNGNVGTMAGPLHIYRIVGIDRIAGV